MKSVHGTKHIEVSHAACCSFNENQMMPLPHLTAMHLFIALTMNSLRCETFDELKLH
jgi:hypothetical protein